MTKPTVHLLLGLGVIFVVLFLFLGPVFAAFGGIIFMVGYSYTRNHNLFFYLTVMAVVAGFYLCARAGYGWLGAIGLVGLSYLLRVGRMYENAKPNQLPGSKPEEQQAPLP